MALILANLDLIVTAIVVLIAAIVFARKGQLDLLRELVLSLTDGVDTSGLYNKLPTATKLLISSKKVNEIVEETKNVQ